MQRIDLQLNGYVNVTVKGAKGVNLLPKGYRRHRPATEAVNVDSLRSTEVILSRYKHDDSVCEVYIFMSSVTHNILTRIKHAAQESKDNDVVNPSVHRPHSQCGERFKEVRKCTLFLQRIEGVAYKRLRAAL